MSEATEMVCVVCDRRPAYAWMDMHGCAQCVWCGTPYRIYHYENDKRIEKEPTVMVDEHWIPILRRFHAETGAKMSAQGMGYSFRGGYDVARQADLEAWKEWHTRNDEECKAATALSEQAMTPPLAR